MSLFTVKITGDGEVLGQISKLRFLALNALRDVVNETSLNVQNEARRNVPVDTGRLRSSVKIEFEQDRLGSSVGTNTDYAPYIEFGTGPAAGKPKYYPPAGVLLGWMQRHGIPSEAESAIRLAIFMKGTQAQPFLFPAWEDERPRFIKEIKKLFRKKFNIRG